MDSPALASIGFPFPPSLSHPLVSHCFSLSGKLIWCTASRCEKADRLLRDGQSLASKARPSWVRTTQGCPVLSYSGYRCFGKSLLYPSIHETKSRGEVAVTGKPVLTDVNQLGRLADDKEWLLMRGQGSVPMYWMS